MAQFTRSGAELFYIDQGDGPAVLFLHGHTLDHTTWDDQVAALVERHRCLTPDVRGHGRSGTPAEGDAVDDALALLDHLGVQRVAIVGASMGGGIALQLAVRAPEKVTALVLCSPAVDDYAWTWAGPRPHAKLARSAGLAAGVQSWLADPLFAPALAQPRSAVILRRVLGAYRGDAWLQPGPRPVTPPQPVLQHVGEITAPTLILVGEHDLPDFHGIAQALASIPGAQARTLPGCGHLCGLESPVAVNAALAPFLAAPP